MNRTALEICNQALARLGAKSIQSFNEPSTEGRLIYHLYPSVRDSLLSAHHWSFATIKRSLALRETQQDEEKAFVVPGDLLVALRCQVGVNTPTIPFQIRGKSLYCRGNHCYLTYVSQVEEGLFPPFFKNAVQTKLLAVLSIPLSESAQQYRALTYEADEALRQARRIESAQETMPIFEDTSLLEVV